MASLRPRDRSLPPWFAANARAWAEKQRKLKRPSMSMPKPNPFPVDGPVKKIIKKIKAELDEFGNVVEPSPPKSPPPPPPPIPPAGGRQIRPIDIN